MMNHDDTIATVASFSFLWTLYEIGIIALLPFSVGSQITFDTGSKSD